MEKLVSIIILNYNNYLYTIDCLKSLTTQTYNNFEVILVDNGSEYDLYLKLKKKLEQFNKNLNINLIRSDLNLYFTGGNNKAIKQAKGEYVCLLNYDTVVQPYFIEKMVDFLEKHPDAGMISPKIKFYKNKAYLWWAGSEIHFRQKQVVKSRGFLKFDPQNKIYNDISIIGGAAGTALFLKKEVINKIGLMDDVFLMYHEDVDWTFKAKEMGYNSYYVPNIIIYHNTTITFSNRKGEFMHYLFNRNLQILVWKHGNFKDLMIFYYHYFLLNIRKIFKHIFISKQRFLAYLELNSIIQGFRIGVKRRTNRSCRKYLLKDYNFLRRINKNF